ncbi:MAG: hypothetical protein ABH876_00945 [Patescibacteria group bacterium]
MILFFKNKRILILTMVVGLILSFLPLHSVEAACSASPLDWPQCIVDFALYLPSLPLRIGFAIFIIPLILAAIGGGLLYSVIVAVCNWMMSIFLQVGITPANSIPAGLPGATPQIVTIGWTFTRDFVNMFFILILVFIGLATILRIKEYEAKKLLPKLIGLALLINFTPVVVGFIVDMGNIVTSFFLNAAGKIINLSTVLDMAFDYALTSMGVIFGQGDFLTMIGQFAGIVIYGIVLTVFYLWGSWIYAWIMLSFVFRITELWVLMILCPIAFFSNIFPPSNTIRMLFPGILHWKKWWEEFLRWIIWAIPIGFFLYLSNWVMANTSVVQGIFDNTTLIDGLNVATEGSTQFPALEGGFITLITSLLTPTLALILLDKGYKIAKQTAPEAAKGILEGTEKLGKLAIAAGITAATAGAGAGLAGGMLGKAGVAATRLETFAGKGRLGIAGKALVSPLTKPIKMFERIAAPPLLKYAAKTREGIKIPEEFKNLSPDEQAIIVRTALTKEAKLKRIAKMVELKTYDKVTDKNFLNETQKIADKLSDDPRYSKDARSVKDKAPNTISEEGIIKMKLVGKITEEEREEVKKTVKKEINRISEDLKNDDTFKLEIDSHAKINKTTFEQASRDIAAGAIYTKEMKGEDWSKITKNSSKSLAVRTGALYSDGRKLSKAADNFGPEFVDNFMEEVAKKGPEWLAENNSAGLLYLCGNAAQDLGYTPPEGIDKEKARKMIENARKEKIENRKNTRTNTKEEKEQKKLDDWMPQGRQGATGTPTKKTKQPSEGQSTMEKPEKEKRPPGRPGI